MSNCYFLEKNSLDNEQIWYVALISIIQLREITLGKNGLVTASTWELDSAPFSFRSDKKCFN